MIAASCLFLVLVTPFFFTPVRVTNPFCYIFLVCTLYFTGKFFYNEAWGTEFLSGVQPAQIADAFYSLALFIGIAYAIALPLCQYRQTPLVATSRPSSKTDRISSFGFKITRTGLITCIVTPLVLFGYGLLQGVNPVENPLLFRQYIQSGGMYYLLALALFLINLIAIYVPYEIIINKRRPSLISTIAYFGLIIFAILSGFGSFVSYFVIAPLYFANSCYRVRIEATLIVLLPFTIFFALVYSSYRDTRLLSDEEITIAEAFTKNSTNPDLYANAMNRFDYLESLTLAAEYTNSIEPDWGVSMLGIFVSPIPRSLWKDKPVGFSTFMTKALYPDVYDIGVTANFNAMNEFTRSFGKLGILIGGVFFGILLVKVYKLFDRSKANPFHATYYICVIFPYLELGFLGGFINELPVPVLILNSLFFSLFVRRTALPTETRKIFRKYYASTDIQKSLNSPSIQRG